MLQYVCMSQYMCMVRIDAPLDSNIQKEANENDREHGSQSSDERQVLARSRAAVHTSTLARPSSRRFWSRARTQYAKGTPLLRTWSTGTGVSIRDCIRSLVPLHMVLLIVLMSADSVSANLSSIHALRAPHAICVPLIIYWHLGPCGVHQLMRSTLKLGALTAQTTVMKS